MRHVILLFVSREGSTVLTISLLILILQFLFFCFMCSPLHCFLLFCFVTIQATTFDPNCQGSYHLFCKLRVLIQIQLNSKKTPRRDLLMWFIIYYFTILYLIKEELGKEKYILMDVCVSFSINLWILCSVSRVLY